MQIHLQHFADFLAAIAVHQQLQALAREWVLDHAELVFQLEQTILARHMAPCTQLRNLFLCLKLRGEKNPLAQAQAVHENPARALQHDRTQRAAKHNQEGGQLKQYGHAAALQHLSAHNAGKRNQQTKQAELVHQYPFSMLRSRATAWLCNWHTRDSPTPNTSPISRRFMSCS
jgi:hypothetical protein